MKTYHNGVYAAGMWRANFSDMICHHGTGRSLEMAVMEAQTMNKFE